MTRQTGLDRAPSTVSVKAVSKGGSGSATFPRPRGETPAADGLTGPHDWYKDAVIYELHVRSFQDSNGDGVGDFVGLTSRLDYLQELGVTAIWLLPFYPSPLRDDGYDIAGYTAINPAYGTMEDFRAFVDEAHRRDIRVITELVINHTSDQHPWFQRARKSPAGSPERDFYVWSDTPEKYAGVRIIFQDTEASNWAWDPIAQQYYWHRFFSHQPDLNFDNPAVTEAVKEVMDFWLEAGVDGMRLDAVPYLIERDGTNCENLDETHAILRDLRSHLDENWPGRMFLAEANQWPEDAIAYFGDGDECHMNFHFPLMPRLFMALRMEDCFPIIDILAQTPPIPESCQWAMFLRNHDELTLEMVTDEERDYMYRSYASDGRMRINVGIRRRLAPLLGHNRRKVELLNGLLMSMPGTPVLYYGDEIGMGDNIYLGDRDAVRTPMQWSSDRNAGFSRVNPQRLFLPINIEPGSHYETVNVESQQSNPSSMLWWMRRLIALRKRHPVLARGTMEILHPDNAKVLAFVRSDDDEDILVVANLSRFAQPVELDLARFEGRTPIEAFGFTRFPKVGELPYLLTLGPHSFYWMILKRDGSGENASTSGQVPVIETAGDPAAWLRGPGLARWASAKLPELLPLRRWFGGKARTIREVGIEHSVSLSDLGEGVTDAALTLVRVAYTEGDDDLYTLPLALLDPERAVLQPGVSAATTLGTVRRKGAEGRLVLIDAAGDASFWTLFDGLIEHGRVVSGVDGGLHGRQIARVSPEDGDDASTDDRPGEVRLSAAEQSNSSAIFGRSSIMKLFRRVEPGINPDFEIGEHLTTVARFEHTPRMLGAVDYRRGKGGSGSVITLAVKQELAANEGDAWGHALDAVGRYLERVLAGPEDPDAVTIPDAPESPLELAWSGERRGWPEHYEGYPDLAALLGRRTGEMHRALASSDEPAFAPEVFSKLYLRSLYQTLRNGVRRSMNTLSVRARSLEGEARVLADEVLSRREEVIERLGAVRDLGPGGLRIRCHGDFHLGQCLWTGRDFLIIDFEGEPMRPLGERRLKRSCLSDVAGMWRSMDYAAGVGVRQAIERGLGGGLGGEGGAGESRLRELADAWSRTARTAFLTGYLGAVDRRLIPDSVESVGTLLDAWVLHKAAYEVDYELNNRPAWVHVPLRGILRTLDGNAPAKGASR